MLESRPADQNTTSDLGCSSGGGGGNGDEEDEIDGKSPEMGKRGFGKAKQVMFYPFRKAKKQILRRRVKRSSSCSSASCNRRTNSSSSSSSSSEKRGFDGTVNQGCCFCLGKLSISDSMKGSPSDPNSRKFTDDMLKVLIEKNDFYSKDSNPHLDVQVDTRQDRYI